MSASAQRVADRFLFLSPWIGLLIAVVIGFAIPIIPGIPDRWDRAVVVRICFDGSKVFRMEDGEYRVRGPNALRSFRAAGADVCG